jgi:DNA polymerase-3 subunit chi
MTRVDFYILPDQQRSNLRLFACRLAEKAWQHGHRILIQTDNAEESRHMDDLLWTFRDGSFIPHGLAGSEDQEQDQQPILISHQDTTAGSFQLLINLSAHIPKDKAFDRIAEIVNQESQRKQQGRDHYKTYRELGAELHHHEMQRP